MYMVKWIITYLVLLVKEDIYTPGNATHTQQVGEFVRNDVATKLVQWIGMN